MDNEKRAAWEAWGTQNKYFGPRVGEDVVRRAKRNFEAGYDAGYAAGVASTEGEGVSEAEWSIADAMDLRS